MERVKVGGDCTDGRGDVKPQERRESVEAEASAAVLAFGGSRVERRPGGDARKCFMTNNGMRRDFSNGHVIV